MRTNFFLKILYAVCFITFLNSCTSAKKLTYFRDLSPNESVPGFPKPPTAYKIRVGDNIFVSLSTQDPATNKMVDPSEGIPSAVAYEGAASKLVNGNLVMADGTIELPLIGKVVVAGKTPAEAEQEVKIASKDYLKDVFVKIRLLNFRVTVLGQVKAPGIYYNYNSYITVIDAISLAQGPTDFAKLDSVLVMRHATNGTSTYSLNLNSKMALASDAYYLQPEDVVILQPGKNIEVQQRLPLATVIVGSLSVILLLLNYLKN